MAEEMKRYMMTTMMIEPFPCLQDHGHIDKLYISTKLAPEKIDNELLEEDRFPLRNYKEMFNSNGRDKILVKADQGMGKTTFGKKVRWDWAKGVLNIFSIVFFVSLRLVKPVDLIENLIIQQTPALESLGISREKLCATLNRFSDRCLLILDGFDEHGPIHNQDVLKIIRNKKLLNCGVVVFSRPDHTREFESHFSDSYQN